MSGLYSKLFVWFFDGMLVVVVVVCCFVVVIVDVIVVVCFGVEKFVILLNEVGC